ncbi:glycosyltransferase family 2 protein [Cellulosimicrobium marinum]|uniref:glycosyltransferase family 2 protein n=1 Tax=Cellulosimicrobium marinum TaxID=1638992 RepID=UPI001E3B4461|nr:glycosyltransferase family 2 protein [Cellulosimicrobium marinum]MCB7137046.1 glycosyltransferase [Cellulosimicrobium marinum]
MSGEHVDVSVVVCTRDRAERLGRSVASVREALDVAADAGLTTELVVVDNGSRDGTASLVDDVAAQDSRVRRVGEPVAGIGRARETGARAARGAVIAYTDDDVVVPPHWLVALTAPVRAGEADVVAGGVRMADDLERPWMTDLLRASYFAHVPEPPAVSPCPMGANVALSRAVLDTLSFDPMLGTARYPGAEDVVLYVQALEAGFRVRGVADAVVRHHFSPDRLDADRLGRQAEGYGRCDAFLYHHWLHTRLRWQRARLAAHGARLALRRALARDGFDERLLQARRELAFHREMLRLRPVPPRYDERGLVLRPEAAG